MWVDNYEILEKKRRDNYNSWIYNLDLNNIIWKFAATQDDSKFKSC